MNQKNPIKQIQKQKAIKILKKLQDDEETPEEHNENLAAEKEKKRSLFLFSLWIITTFV